MFVSTWRIMRLDRPILDTMFCQSITNQTKHKKAIFIMSEDFRRRMLQARIAPSTAELYQRLVEGLVREELTCSYEGLLSYFARYEGKKSVGQMRTLKCAVLHQLRLDGKPMCPSAAEDLDRVLQGVAALESEARRAPVRGAIEDHQLEQLVAPGQRRGRVEDSEAFLVMRGATCRPRDMGELTPQRVNLEALLVQVRSKRPRHAKASGEYETHPIITEAARAILARRMGAVATEQSRLFPAWTTQRAATLVQEAASTFKWTQSLKWDGSHCLRHGSANAVYLEAIERVRVAGGWKTVSSAAHYSAPNLGRQK